MHAIVVPASRSARHLDFAIYLARMSGAMLVVLCSRGADVVDVRRRVAQGGCTRAMIIAVPDDYQVPGFTSLVGTDDQLEPARAGRSSDLSAKRNVGLLLARMLGWQNVVFLDDDIYRVSPADIGRLVGQLSTSPVAGMASIDFPDNSVVCHANRLSGNEQDVMVSGSVLAVNCALPAVPYFPDVYNEDWFFFYDCAARRRLGHAGYSQQLMYDPFEDPERAAREEFGDLLAEGLFAYIEGLGPLGDEEALVPPANEAYWDEFRTVRGAFIDNALAAFDENNTFDSRAIASLESARNQLRLITPAHCVRFFDLLQNERASWNDLLKHTPKDLPAGAALDRLQLSGVDTTGRLIR